MPTLHDLFDTASDGLPPLPDLAPAARRIARRRQLAARTTAAVLGSALVIGEGTVLITASPGTGSGYELEVGAAPTTTHTRPLQHAATFHDEAVAALQKIWPVKGERIVYTGEPDSQSYEVVTSSGAYRLTLTLHSLAANDPQNQLHIPCATDTASRTSFACASLPGGQTVAARNGEGTAEFDFAINRISVMLNVTGAPVTRLDAQRLLAMATSDVFQQLVADAHHYKGVLT